MKRSILPSRLRSGKKPLETSDTKTTEFGGKFSWFDLQNPSRAQVETLAERFHLNELNVEDCMTKFELPKIDSYDDHFFVILHFPPLLKKNRIQKYRQLSMFVGKDFLITIHQGDMAPLVDLVNICKNSTDKEKKDRLLGRSSGVLLHEIIDALVDELLHTARKIIANLDDIEDGVFDETKSVARKISYLRREIITVRRIANHLRRIVLSIGEKIKPFTKSEELELYFDDVIDHIDKVIESVDESRETMEVYKDTDFMLSTEKTNKVLAALTIIFTLAIPATIIGTFYGMNVNLPGADLGGPLGPYQAFILVLLASIIPAILMIVYFRRLGWMAH